MIKNAKSTKVNLKANEPGHYKGREKEPGKWKGNTNFTLVRTHTQTQTHFHSQGVMYWRIGESLHVPIDTKHCIAAQPATSLEKLFKSTLWH